MNKYNPFTEVYEPNTKYKHARTKRSSLWQKLKITYFSFAGRYASSGKAHAGLYDYLTLGVTKVLSRLVNTVFVAGYTALFVSIIGIPLIPALFSAHLVVGAAFLALEGVRHVAALALTVVSAPFVAITHLVSSFFSRKEKAAVKSIQVQSNDSDFNLSETRKTTLGRFLEKGSNLDDVKVTLSGTTSSLKVVFETNDLKAKTCEATLSLYSRDDNGEKMVLNEVDRQSFKALRSLNVGNGNLYSQWQQIKTGEQPDSFMSNEPSVASDEPSQPRSLRNS